MSHTNNTLFVRVVFFYGETLQLLQPLGDDQLLKKYGFRKFTHCMGMIACVKHKLLSDFAVFPYAT